VPVRRVTKGRSVSTTTSPDHDPSGIEYPGWGPVGELSLGSGHCIGTDAAKTKQEYGPRLAAQPSELGKVPRRQQGSFTDESITGWETILHQQTSTRAAAITGRSPHPR
jgi:hypothetical protein